VYSSGSNRVSRRAIAHRPGREQGLKTLREAATLRRRKATPEEAEGYRAFVMALAERVAEAHKEGGQKISERERTARGEIEQALTA
jgi:hypothetical protein